MKIFSFAFSFFLFILLLALPGLSSAQTSTTIYRIPPPQSLLPFGQNHYYTVTLRGNGQAIVFLKTILSNSEEASFSAVQLMFPNPPKTFAVYQAHREPQCVSYKPAPLPTNSNLQQECLQYQEPDYLYGWGNTSYLKAPHTLNGNTATIILPKPIKPNGTGSLILAYVSPKITTKDLFGAYQFTFETVRVSESIQTLQVGISSDPEYYLKDAKGGINYQSKETSTMPSAESFASGGISNSQFDQFYNQIGQGDIIKTATNLQPNESYTTKGIYADSKIKLYGKEIVIGLIATVVILILAVWGLFWSFRRIKQQSSPAGKTMFLTVLGASFGASLFIVLYTFGLYLFSTYFGQVFQFYSYNFAYPILLILLGVISLSVYSLFLFAPGVFIGFKKGIVAGVLTIVLTIFWLIVQGIILAGVFFLFFQNTTPPIIYPQPMDVMKSQESSGVTPQQQ